MDAFAKEFPDAITTQNVNDTNYRIKARDYKSFQEEFFPKTSPTSEVGSVANKNMQDNIKDLHTELIKAGYKESDIGNESQFREKLRDKKNRFELYHYVMNRQDFNLGSYDGYEKKSYLRFQKLLQLRKSKKTE